MGVAFKKYTLSQLNFLKKHAYELGFFYIEAKYKTM